MTLINNYQLVHSTYEKITSEEVKKYVKNSGEWNSWIEQNDLNESKAQTIVALINNVDKIFHLVKVHPELKARIGGDRPMTTEEKRIFSFGKIKITEGVMHKITWSEFLK